MKRWLRLVLASTPLLLLAYPPSPAGADSKFASIQFTDQARIVSLTLPAVSCRMDRAHAESCQWELFVNEPDAPGQPVVGTAAGTSGVLSVPYPAGFCGVLQADALFGAPLHKTIGFRHQIRTCNCPVMPAWPAVLSGASPVHPHSTQGVYLSEIDNSWTMYATHPHGTGEVFSGTITTNGTFTHLTTLKFEGHDRADQTAPNQIAFRFVNRGYLDGISFVPACASQITFDTSINGSPAPPSHIFLGPTLNPPASSPVTFSG